MKAILMYHSVDPSGSVISIEKDAFAAHVKWLSSGDVSVVPLDRINEMPDDEDVVAVTFDDGFENFADIAWPLLREHGVPVTVFVVAGMVGKTNAWCANDQPAVPEMPLAGWDALGKLAEAGVAIGAHTQTHKNLKVTRGEQLQAEIETAAETIAARVGQRPSTFAYPYGAHDDEAVSVAARCHALACTTELRVLGASEDLMRLPRLDTYYFRSAGLLESYGTARFRQYLTLRRAGRAVRAVLVHGGAHA